MKAHPWGVSLVCLIMMIFVSPPSAFAQDSSAVVSEEAREVMDDKITEFRESLEEKGRKFLSVQIPDGRFLLVLDAKLNTKKFVADAQANAEKVQLQSVLGVMGPPEFQLSLARSLSGVGVKPYVGISATLTLDEEITPAQEALLGEALKGVLGLRNIKVSRSDMALPSEKKKIEAAERTVTEREQEVIKIEKEKSVLESAKRQEELKFKMDIDKADRQKDQLQSQLSAAADRTKVVEKELEGAKKRIRELEEDVSVYKTPLGEIKRIIKGLEVPLMVLPFAVLILIFATLALVIYNSVSKSRTKRIYESVELLSQALGKSLGRSAGHTVNPVALRSASAEAREQLPGSLPAPGQAQLSMDEVKALRSEAELAWKECLANEYLALAELKEWIASGEDGMQRFLTFLSALPPSEATRIVSTFSNEDLAALRSVYVDASNRMAGLSLILSLHRTVLSESLRAVSLAQGLRASALIAASDGQVAVSLMSQDARSRSICMSVLPPGRFVRVAELMQSQDPALSLADTFQAMAEGFDKEEAALTLEKWILGLEDVIRTVRSNDRQAVFDLLLGSREIMGPRLRASLSEAMGNSQDLALAAEARSVTFENVMLLDDESLRELVMELEPEQIAQLLMASKDEHRQRILGLVTNKIRISVETELARLTKGSSQRKRAQAMGNTYQEMLVQNLVSMSQQGLLEIPRLHFVSGPESDAPGEGEGGDDLGESAKVVS